jgi:hypothetical protein
VSLEEALPDLAAASTGWLSTAVIGVPVSPGRLPDGRPVIVLGNVRSYAAFNHVQGDNPDHDYGDCGIVSCADVLDQFGLRLTEADVIRHATRCREAHLVAGRPERSGWTVPSEQAQILSDYGVPARALRDQSADQLASAVQLGYGVIAGVNAGVLWTDSRFLGDGQANHAVTVTGIAREPYDGALEGFYINDSASGMSAEYVSVPLMTTAFVRTGGFCVVTQISPGRRNPVETAGGTAS